MRVSADMPDDVLVLHDALEQLREHKTGEPLTLYLKNCGTALRFLQVHLEYCYKGEPIVLDGDPRLMERNGAPTTQTTSARILHGEPIPVSENESPYITLSRRIRESYLSPLRGEPERGFPMPFPRTTTPSTTPGSKRCMSIPRCASKTNVRSGSTGAPSGM